MYIQHRHVFLLPVTLNAATYRCSVVFKKSEPPTADTKKTPIVALWEWHFAQALGQCDGCQNVEVVDIKHEIHV